MKYVKITALSICLTLISQAGCTFSSQKILTKNELAFTQTEHNHKYYIQKDVPYLPRNHRNSLDIYFPANFFETNKTYPAIINIHGGGWAAGSKEKNIAVKCAQMLANKGYIVFTNNYTLNKEGTKAWPENLKDCQNAILFAQDNYSKYRIDPKRIGVIGNSAGAHLALLTAFTLNNAIHSAQIDYKYQTVKCIVDMYGITDVRIWGKEMFAKSTDKNAENIWKQASPIFHINSKTPPVLVIHGSKDTGVPIEHSEILVDKLQNFGIEHEFLIVEGAPHGFTPFWQTNTDLNIKDKITTFFDKHLK